MPGFAGSTPIVANSSDQLNLPYPINRHKKRDNWRSVWNLFREHNELITLFGTTTDKQVDSSRLNFKNPQKNFNNRLIITVREQF